MRKRTTKQRPKKPETMWQRTAKRRPEKLNPPREEEGDGNEQEDKSKEGKGFYACYLLTSLCPRFKGHTYIGFTVNPRRRIRQHNGEITSGAFRTKKRRPWEMVFCIYGFPTNVSALQFEWAWQHPTESVAVRQAAATFKSFSGVANKIKLAYTMLNLPAWQGLNITVNYFSTKYSSHSASSPSLLEHMRIRVCPIDELPCYTETNESLFEGEDAEDRFDDTEEYENTTNISETLNMNVMDLQAYSTEEFPCYNRDEETSFEGEGSKVSKENEKDSSTKYANHSASSPSFREQVKIRVCPINELPCYTETNESLFEGEDAVKRFDDKEEYENTTNRSETMNMNVIDLQAYSANDFPYYNRVEEILFEGEGSKVRKEDEEDCDSGNTSRTAKETHADTIIQISSNNATSHEETRQFEEYSNMQQSLRSISSFFLPTLEEDHMQPSVSINSVVGTALTGFSMEEMLVNNTVPELDWLNGKEYTGKSDKDLQPIHSYTVPDEIEKKRKEKKRDESLFEGEDAEDRFDDTEEYENTTNISETLNMNVMDLQAYSTEEFPCYNRDEETSFEGEGSKVSKENEKDSSTKYANHSASSPSFREQVKIRVCPINELPCYTETNESLFEGEDAVKRFDDKEEYENTTNRSETMNMNVIDLQAYSANDFPYYNRVEEILFEGEGSKVRKEDEEDCDSGNTSRTAKETHADTIIQISSNNATSHEETRQFEEYSNMQQSLRSISSFFLPTLEEDHMQPSVSINSVVGTALTGFSMEEMLVNNTVPELDWLNGKEYTGKSDKDLQPIHSYTVPDEIEVIDLLSPSPECRIRASRKKRRVSIVCPEIIDLT
ncbi:hypothetical protein JCGZ_17331 [Jatropha curcas]|uniref:Structure-specific endonuclease subunit SLX1 homolog n=1 Tax=Jatropha curcas TaxID=180498 RepID=A0A067LMU5_JATCU|nr:hypothetical protein JCGZ_17331 [Jatropha curcas]